MTVTSLFPIRIQPSSGTHAGPGLLALALLALLAPAPAGAQQIWSADLTVSADPPNELGCSDNRSSELVACSTALTDNDIVYDDNITNTIHNVLLYSNGNFTFGIKDPGNRELMERGVLVLGGTVLEFSKNGVVSSSGRSVSFYGTDLSWTAGQVVPISLSFDSVPASLLPVSLRTKYDWCFNRDDMSEQDCADAILQWEDQPDEIDLPASGHCPRTHAIRKSTTNGIKCQKTFHYVGGEGPGKPTDFRVWLAPDGGSATLSWSPADPGGAELKWYEYRYRVQGSSWTGWARVPISHRLMERVVLPNSLTGKSITFNLRAVNFARPGRLVEVLTGFGPPQLSMKHNHGVREGPGATLDFAVTLNFPSAGTVTVDYSTGPAASDPATDGVDFTSVSGTLTFAPGETSKIVSVPVLDDDVAESREWVAINLSNAQGGTISVPATNGAIEDDDTSGQSLDGIEPAQPVSLAVSQNPVPEGSGLTVTATLAAALSADASIPLTVTRGTSEEGDHGTLSSITVSAGATTGTGAIAVPIDADGDDETFTVALDTANLPPSVTAGEPAAVTVTINDTTAVTDPDPLFPAAPATLEATPGDGQVALSWSGVAGATSWEYRRDSGAWTGTGGEDRTHTVTGLSNGTEYSFQVRAVQLGIIKGNASASVSATPAAAQALGQTAPALPDAVAAASVRVTHNGTSLSVSWHAPARASHYDVTYYAAGQAHARAAWNRAGTSLMIACDVREGHENQSCVHAGASYFVGIRARNASGESGWSYTASAASPPPPLSFRDCATGTPASGRLKVQAPGGTGAFATLCFGPVSAAMGYGLDGGGDANRAKDAEAFDMPGIPDEVTAGGVTMMRVGISRKSSAPNWPLGPDDDGIWIFNAEVTDATSSATREIKVVAPGIWVEDAAVSEPTGSDTASLSFNVELYPPGAKQVTVDYATSDGTATKGSDYTATSGTLTFTPGEWRKTVAVPVLADAVDDSGETLTLTLSNASGATIADGEATGTITNQGPIPKAWIGRFGRTMAHQVLEGGEARLQQEPTPGREMVLAGIRLSDAEWRHARGQQSSGLDAFTLSNNDLLTTTSFALTSESDSGDGVRSIWGRGASTSFDGRQGELSLDGNVTTALLGADWSWGHNPLRDGETAAAGDRGWRAGLVLAHSRGDGRYHGADGNATPGEGKLKAHLTGVFPWARRALNHRLAAWGVAGYGRGELTVTPRNSGALNADLNLWLAAAGLRGALLDGGSTGLTLTGTTDALVVGTSSGQVTGAQGHLSAADARVTRLRLGLEASRTMEFGNGATLTPSLETGLRYDGGDAETGFGLDLGGGISLASPNHGLAAELRGRGLLSHAAEGFKDRGFSGSLSWQQQPDSDRGAILSLTHTVGGSSTGGMDALLNRTTLEGLVAANGDNNEDLNNQRLELQLSYGLPAFNDRFTLTPELGLGFYDSGRDYRIGWSLSRLVGSLELSFDLTRWEDGNNGNAPDHGVELRLDTLF